MTEPNASIETSYRDGTCVITMNRPERYNTITIPVMQRLRTALDEADANEGVRCVILTAAGRSFCAGQDLKVLAKFYEQHHPGELGDVLRDHYNAVVERIWSLGKPVIAAIQGIAAGAGWSLALACDLRVAGRSARFVPAFAKLGLVPDMGGTTSLVRAVGYAKAVEYALFTESMTADEALEFGLLNRVVPDEELMAVARELAQRINALPPTGVRLTKQALQGGIIEDPLRQLQTEAWLQAVAAATPEHAKQVIAFTTKAAR